MILNSPGHPSTGVFFGMQEAAVHLQYFSERFWTQTSRRGDGFVQTCQIYWRWVWNYALCEIMKRHKTRDRTIPPSNDYCWDVFGKKHMTCLHNGKGLNKVLHSSYLATLSRWKTWIVFPKFLRLVKCYNMLTGSLQTTEGRSSIVALKSFVDNYCSSRLMTSCWLFSNIWLELCFLPYPFVFFMIYFVPVYCNNNCHLLLSIFFPLYIKTKKSI